MPLEAVGRRSGDQRVFENTTVRPITFLLIFAVLLPVIAAFGILYRRSLSVPYQDDYDTIIAFGVHYAQSPTLKAKLLEIAAEQHNEYKLGFEHSIVAAELELTHHLNFTFLTVLGDLFLLPLGYLLWRTYQPDEIGLDRRLLGFLPISLLFFSLTYWENLNWATTGLQNTPVVLFSLLSISLIAPGKTPSTAHLLLGCLAAALAAFTSANGFLLGPVGLWILLARRAYGGSVAWCASFILPLAAYLYHFTPSVYVVQRFFYLTRPLFFLGFLGCAVPFRWVAAPLGLVLMSIFVWAVHARFDRTNPVAFYFTVWIVATGCLVGWVRGGETFRNRLPIQHVLHFDADLLLFLPGTVFTRPLVPFQPDALLRNFHSAGCGFLLFGRRICLQNSPDPAPVDSRRHRVLPRQSSSQFAPQQSGRWSRVSPKKRPSSRVC